MIEPYRYDWTRFTADDLAVLCFVRAARRVLLIRKRRGRGAGKINAPTGKCEPGETPYRAAIRETHEEVGIVPGDLRCHGVLRFAFTDGYSLKVYVYLAYRHSGRAIDTEEAFPVWTDIDRIPFDEMWADDRVWLPRVLGGQHVESEMLFHEDAMIEWDVRFSNGAHVKGCDPHVASYSSAARDTT
jgi:8-oxo-dGTP diphosphatase